MSGFKGDNMERSKRDQVSKQTATLLCLMVAFIGFFSVSILFSVPVLAQQESDNVSSELSLKQLLLMPEELTQGHAKIESQCQKCHLHFDKSNQSPLCLDCHEKIDKDLSSKKGFHSNIPTAQIKECRGCHTDHKGRNFDITALDKDRFDHGMTEFALKGSHQSIDCVDCHKKTDKNFRIPLEVGQCTTCHKDPHDGELSKHFSQSMTDKTDTLGRAITEVETCGQCHNEKSWKVKNFDHSKTTFALKGKHENVECKSCHVNDVAVEIGSECVNCHLSRDKHMQTFGRKCQSCHSEKGWDKTQYNHFKETKFKLLGKHEKLACEVCHATSYISKDTFSNTSNNANKNASNTASKNIKAISASKLPNNPKSQLTKKPFKHLQGQAPKVTCNGCHKKDDVHLGNNGSDCKQCHNNTDWQKNNFNHDEDTHFSLQGIHKTLSCPACHTDEQKTIKKHNLTPKEEVRNCYDCHQLADPHNNQLGKKCQNCHQQENWQKNVTFNHDFTLFPLTGAHQLQVCSSCHESADFTIKAFKCDDCHSSDDFHQGVLGNKCGNCHNSASWTSWQFDHQTQTKFSLTGAHQQLECEACHTNDLVKPLFPAKACVACHENDDAHDGAFGRNCQQCHKTDHFYDFKH